MKRMLLPLLVVPALWAQQAGPISSEDHALIQQLLERVKELEGEVRQLKAAARPGESLAAAPPPPPAAPAMVSARPAQPAQEMVHDVPVPGTQGIQFRGFSDIRYRASDAKGDHTTFSLGQFNLFITSKLSDRFSVLSEMVVEADERNGVGVDLERLLLEFTANDYFNLGIGRYHTAIGYYNTAYHHSTWMQTTVDRPFLFAFEDEGGILPIHNVGLTASGRIPSGGLGLHYIAEIGNGRASRSPLDEAVQNVQDENNHKAVNAGVFARPDRLRDFQAGFSVYREVVYPDGLPKIGQTIFAAHAVYHPTGFEFLNEAVLVRHALAGSSSNVFRIPAFYSQISKQFGKVRPYFRYEYMNVPRREPLFGDVGLLHGPLTGIRYDINEFAAFKLEYNRLMRRDPASINMLRTQVSFTF